MRYLNAKFVNQLNLTMKPDFLKIFILFVWLCLPGFIVLNTNHVQDSGEALAIISFTIFIILCPLLCVPRIRSYFLIWTPIAFLTLPYCYLILIYHSVPGDALVSAVVHTSLAQSLEVFFSFGWKVLAIPFCGMTYFFVARSISKELRISGHARKNLLAALLMFAMLNMVTREALDQHVKAPPMFEEYTFNLCFPSSLIMSISRVINNDGKNTANATVHGEMTNNFSSSKIIVLVIGESARSDHLGINSYLRNTTPNLKLLGDQIISFKDVASTANATYLAVPNIVLRQHKKDRASLVQTFREAGFKTAWFSNQERSFFSKNAEISNFPDSAFDFRLRKDMSLLPLFESFVHQAGPYQFIVLHMEGSHITYDERYTSDSKIFYPTLSDIGIADPLPSNKREAINSYDNTIIETDKFLYSIISILNNQKKPAILLYTSDHGENLFDDERRLFMHTQFPPTRYDTHVPLLLWMNSDFDKNQPNVNINLRNNSQKEITHRNVFPSLLDIAGLKWEGKSETDSFASAQFKETKRMVISPQGNGEFDYDSLR